MADPTRPSTKDHRFDHPIIDSDGHFVEFFPGFLDYLEREVGPSSTERFQAEWDRTYLSTRWYEESAEERRARRSVRPAFWNVPTRNTLDLATAMLPELLYQRLNMDLSHSRDE